MEPMSQQATLKTEYGIALFELMVSLLITSVVLAGITMAYLSNVRAAHDHELKSRTLQRARLALGLIGKDLRSMGEGVPFHLDNFQIGTAGLSDAPLPLLLTSDADEVTLRKVQGEKLSELTAVYTPSVVDLTFSVLNTDDFSVDDMVYLSNEPIGGNQGLQGIVTAKSSGTLTIDSSYISSAGAVFPIGSSVHKVIEVKYSSNIIGGIRRQAEGATVTVLETGTFVLDYQDSSGSSLSTPLTDADVRDQLAKVNIQLSVDSEFELKSGGSYNMTFEKDVSLRNLTLSR